MLFEIRCPGTQTGRRKNVGTRSWRRRRATKPGVEPLEGKVLLAAHVIITNLGNATSINLGIGSETKSSSPGGYGTLSIAVDDGLNGFYQNGTPYLAYDDGGSVESGTVFGTLTLATSSSLQGGVPLAVNNALTADLLLQVAPDAGDKTGEPVQVTLNLTGAVQATGNVQDAAYGFPQYGKDQVGSVVYQFQASYQYTDPTTPSNSQSGTIIDGSVSTLAVSNIPAGAPSVSIPAGAATINTFIGDMVDVQMSLGDHPEHLPIRHL